MHTIGSERCYKPGALITIDQVAYRVKTCTPTRHKGWWKLEVEHASTSTDQATPDGLSWEALEHSKEYSKTKFGSPSAAYYWTLANLAGGDATVICDLQDDGISVISFEPSEDELEYFKLGDLDEVFLIEDDQGFVELRDRWTGYRPENDLHEEGEED